MNPKLREEIMQELSDRDRVIIELITERIKEKAKPKNRKSLSPVAASFWTIILLTFITPVFIFILSFLGVPVETINIGFGVMLGAIIMLPWAETQNEKK
jgi:Na+/H+ antiporter NhaC